MIPRRGSAKKKHEARLAWLGPRFEAWADVPGIDQDVTDAGRARLEQLRAEMVAAGLFGSSTEQIQREAIRRLLSELRGKNVEVRW